MRLYFKPDGSINYRNLTLATLFVGAFYIKTFISSIGIHSEIFYL